MELAGPITLSPTDQAGLVLVMAVAALVVVSLVAAAVAALVGSARRPARAGSYAARSAATVLVIGGLVTIGLVATIASGPDHTRSSTVAPATTWTPVTVLTPQHLAACDGAAWTERVRHRVAAHGSPSLVRCTSAYAVVDVDTIRGGPDHAALRSYWHRLPSGDWTTLAVDADTGCGRVLTADPSFPVELCQDLPGPLDDEDRNVVVPPLVPTTTA